MRWAKAVSNVTTAGSVPAWPMMSTTLDTHVESLLMLRPGAQADELYALRLWPAPAQLQPGQAPLWLGSAQTLHYKRHFKLFGLWLPRPGTEPALDALRQALEGMETREQVLPESEMPLLMVRSETQP